MYQCNCNQIVTKLYLLDHNDITRATPNTGKWRCVDCVLSLKGEGMYIQRKKLKRHTLALKLSPSRITF